MGAEFREMVDTAADAERTLLNVHRRTQLEFGSECQRLLAATADVVQ